MIRYLPRRNIFDLSNVPITREDAQKITLGMPLDRAFTRLRDVFSHIPSTTLYLICKYLIYRPDCWYVEKDDRVQKLTVNSTISVSLLTDNRMCSSVVVKVDETGIWVIMDGEPRKLGQTYIQPRTKKELTLILS